MKHAILGFLLITIHFLGCSQQKKTSSPYVLIIQPIVVQSDKGDNPASIAVPEELVDRSYEKAGVDFRFLEPIFYNDTKTRDGLINLDEIVENVRKEGILRGQDDVVNMFFVNAVDGNKGPLGRGMMNGNFTFIALGERTEEEDDRELKYMQAFVIAHEVGHNLSLKHIIDDDNIPDDVPNIQGDGNFKDRIDPKYSLTDYQIDIVRKSNLVHPRIDFLKKEKGEIAILDETFEPYFSQLQIREISAFVGENPPLQQVDSARVFARKKFASAVTNFTPKEKKCISYVTERVIEILEKNSISLMADQPWRFIKIEDWLCGGFAHTRGTYIILSQRHIDYLTKEWSENMTPEDEQALVVKLGGLLVHEQMHSLQRTYKSRFTKLYTENWNFVRADITVDESIKVDQVSNPDAPIAEWLISNPVDKDSYYWLRTLLKKGKGIPVMGKDFVDKVFIIRKMNGNYFVQKDSLQNPNYKTVDDIPFYKNSFPTSRGLDHPNEISAYMFSDYFKALAEEKKPFSDTAPEASKNAKAFTDWIKVYMK
ncbi:hypothetical protein ACEZ3G_14390 [Maribacter algicola]|uniref:Uncharacterized protein n=1 Tax=Meishania litoralis TaxID=3434685 RepID=A0ACC7LN19_9FLAO